jgi:predicted Fe-S protein YdhL (DUF1289 family)
MRWLCTVTEKDWEGCGRDLFEVVSWHSLGIPEEIHETVEEPIPNQQSNWLRPESRQIFTASVARFG